jgi:hypothetical protein
VTGTAPAPAELFRPRPVVRPHPMARAKNSAQPEINKPRIDIMSLTPCGKGRCVGRLKAILLHQTNPAKNFSWWMTRRP